MIDMNAHLATKRIAILASDGFEEEELLITRNAMVASGASVSIISPKEKIRSWREGHWGDEIHTDCLIEEVFAEDFDALFIPGGLLNQDQLRSNKNVIHVVQEFAKKGKKIASLCHGPQILIEAGLTKGRYLTSWPTLKTDLINSGAVWSNEEVVVDGPYITAGSPNALFSFVKVLIHEFAVNHYLH